MSFGPYNSNRAKTMTTKFSVVANGGPQSMFLVFSFLKNPKMFVRLNKLNLYLSV